MRKTNLFILILAILSPIFIAASIASFKKYSNVAEEFYRQQKELAKLLEEKELLKKTIAYFSSNINIEKEARLRFNLIKEGEITVIFVSPKPQPSPSPLAVPSATSFQLLRQFFNKFFLK